MALGPTPPTDLAPVISQFQLDHGTFVASADGTKTLGAAVAFARIPAAKLNDPASRALPEAASTLAWLNRMPSAIAQAPVRPLIDFKSLPPDSRDKALTASFEVLRVGLNALLSGAGTGDKLEVDRLLQTAFGADAASIALRKPFSDDPPTDDGTIPSPKFPTPILPGDFNIDKLVQSGGLQDAFSSFARCAAAAQSQRDWHATVRKFGHVTALKPNRGCPGDTIEVAYEGFGDSPPGLSAGCRLVIGLAQTGGATQFVDVDKIALDYSTGAGWKASGEMRIQLPDNVSSGCVDFFILQPRPGAPSDCDGGSLMANIGVLQSAFM
jgi:hypothetical protein